MMASQELARAALAAAVAEADTSRVPMPGAAVQRLQAVSGVVASGDRTLDQVRSQLRAFGCDAYEVQPIPPKGVEGLRRERIRKWTTDQIEKGLGWLKRMNVLGYDIYIRPLAPTEDTTQPFVFIDDADQATVDRMTADGFPFAVLNESSPRRFHGWVRIASTPLYRDEVSRCGRMLAQSYGGDPQSTDWRHYGRLAGTTNQKPSRRTAKGPPFVMLRVSTGAVAPGGEMLLAQARQSLEHDERLAARAAQETERSRASNSNRTRMADAVTALEEARAGASPARIDDESGRDFAGALSLLRRGYDLEEVKTAMRQVSPELAKRHRDPEAYVQRTVERAAAMVASTPGIPRLR